MSLTRLTEDAVLTMFPNSLAYLSDCARSIVLEKLTSKENTAWFHAERHQRQLVLSVVKHLLIDNEDLDVCCKEHNPEIVLPNILWAATNTLLKNYVQMKTDKLTAAKKGATLNRKLKTLN
ncbi:hypothetical protein HPB51_006065 [Rhipicephalus microplus]|uniref:Uncharacterized protein n=1 Tax=Rhipicephalus microplus TaxID=6941 RepID=A0A9J6DKX3_RHIMP|nr:hypothetical protein HPB51_028949 [Rhipicephalus microplus]KAH8022837.1 hypothetical protein HPB51_006065 [Rhipicephalus microplus]